MKGFVPFHRVDAEISEDKWQLKVDGNPFSSCWDISVWTEAVERLTDCQKCFDAFSCTQTRVKSCEQSTLLICLCVASQNEVYEQFGQDFYWLNPPCFYSRQYLSAPHKPSLLWPPVTFAPSTVQAFPPPLLKQEQSDCVKQKASTVDTKCTLFSFHLLPVRNSWLQLICSCQVSRVTGVLISHFRLLWTDWSPQKRRLGNNLSCYSDGTCDVEAPCLQTGWIMISVSKWGVQMECGSLSCLALPPLNWCTDCHFTVVH